jgi:hypothetical protein
LVLLFAVAVAVIGGVWWWQCPPPEPVYDGQRLSQWIAARPAQLEDEALRPFEIEAFGPEAIPWLIHMVQHGRHPVLLRGPRPFTKFPNWFRRYLPQSLGGLRPGPRDQRVDAIYALECLGPKAAPAIPVLARVLRGKDEDLARVVVDVVHSMGPVSWPAVEEGLQHGTHDVRYQLVLWMPRRLLVDGVPASDAELAHIAEILERTCGDPEGIVRVQAARALTACHLSRKDNTLFASAIPHLLQLLSDADPSVQSLACTQLSDLGLEASPAIPRLIDLVTHQDSVVRCSAASALLRIGINPENAAPHLRDMLHDPDLNCREIAAYALKYFHFSLTEVNPDQVGAAAR